MGTAFALAASAKAAKFSLWWLSDGLYTLARTAKASLTTAPAGKRTMAGGRFLLSSRWEETGLTMDWMSANSRRLC